jgi:hypothetical protein
MAVPDELTRGLAARGEAHAVDHVVQTALERGEEVVPVTPGSAETRSNVLRNCFSLSP